MTIKASVYIATSLDGFDQTTHHTRKSG